MPETQIFTSSHSKEAVKPAPPPQYKVIMINDDVTTMEFVVAILIDIFHKDELTANELMMKVHKTGKAVVGVYPYDIAQTRVDLALRRANDEGFPFRMKIEEE